MNANETQTPAEPRPHTYSNDPIYDGRCIFCDIRGGGRHSSEPCRGQ
jgi:hypothetical protein